MTQEGVNENEVYDSEPREKTIYDLFRSIMILIGDAHIKVNSDNKIVEIKPVNEKK